MTSSAGSSLRTLSLHPLHLFTGRYTSAGRSSRTLRYIRYIRYTRYIRQVLAYSLGLGELLTQPTRLDSHLAATVSANCIHTDVASGELRAGCENGLVIMTGRPLQPSGQTTASDLQA